MSALELHASNARRQQMDRPDRFTIELDRLWQQVRPLYVSLHAYVRARLLHESALYEEALEMTRRLAREEGIFAGISAAGAFPELQFLPVIPDPDKIICAGTSFARTLFHEPQSSLPKIADDAALNVRVSKSSFSVVHP